MGGTTGHGFPCRSKTGKIGKIQRRTCKLTISLIYSEPRNWGSATPLVLKYGVFLWRVLQTFVGSPKQYYSKPRHTASLGYDSNFKWGSLINCNETTKVNALYNCNWNVEIMADTKRVAGNMEDSSLEAKAKVSGGCMPSSKWAWLDVYERTRVGVCCTACCCVRKPRADIQFPFPNSNKYMEIHVVFPGVSWTCHNSTCTSTVLPA